ncbi:hypothetical protein SAMN06272759_105331 [Novosphingobium sp. B1]|nr:hypothetical protein SAMN06272759_105331 [Novosphingobium sp. B1]
MMNDPQNNVHLSKDETALYRARQRSRNKVLGIVLGSLAVLFFAISIVKIAAQVTGSH